MKYKFVGNFGAIMANSKFFSIDLDEIPNFRGFSGRLRKISLNYY